RVHEREPALIGHPADRVAVRPAAKAVIEALLIVDGETRRLLVVERATGLPLAPRTLELGRTHDHARQRDPGAQLVEKLRRQHRVPRTAWRRAAAATLEHVRASTRRSRS